MNRLAEIYAVRSFANHHARQTSSDNEKKSSMRNGDMRYDMHSIRMSDRRDHWFHELRVVNIWNGSLLFFGNGTNLDVILGEYERFHKDHEDMYPVETIIPRTMYDSIW